MRRGTTPTCTFRSSVDLTEAVVIYVTFRQHRTRVEYSLEDDNVEVTSTSVAVTLTQADTLKFSSDENLEIQVRAKFADGKAIESNIVTTTMGRVLKEGEI